MLTDCSTEALPRRLEVPNELRAVMRPAVAQLRLVTRAIRQYDRMVEQACQRYPATVLLRQVEGVGPVTALAYVLVVRDPARFGKNRDVAAYIGLTPKRDRSGQQDPQLGITKAGDEYLRQLLVGSAQYILGPLCRQDSELRQWGLQRLARAPKDANHKKRTVVAAARRLSVLLLHLWRNAKLYEPVRQGTRDTVAA